MSKNLVLIFLFIVGIVLFNDEKVNAQDAFAITKEGYLQTLIVDELDMSTGKMKCQIVQYLRTDDNQLHRLEDTQGVLREIKPSSRIFITGTIAEDKIIVSNVSVRKEKKIPSVQLQPETYGEQKAIVALFNYPDKLNQPFTLKDVKNKVMYNIDSTNNFIKENSYNKTWINADFIDWKTLPHNSTYYSGNDWSSLLLNDSIEIVDPLVNFKNYTRLIFIYLDSNSNDLCGLGSIGKWWLHSSGDGNFIASVSWINENCAGSGVISHEFGHNLGFSHASTIECDETSNYVPKSMLDPTYSCSSIIEYGDDGDTMGNAWMHNHFSSIYKSEAEWIESSQIQDVNTSGEYIIDQVEIASDGKKVLRIPLGRDFDDKNFYYWIEYRKNNGIFDDEDIVQIRMKQNRTYTGSSWSYNSIRFAPGVIDENTPFYNPYRGIKIELIERTGSGSESKAKLKVSFSDAEIIPSDVLDFGKVFNGNIVFSNVTIKNNTVASLDIGNLSIDGRNEGLFKIIEDGCSNKSLAPNESCNVTLSFSPDSAGYKFGVLTVPANDSIMYQGSVSLKGSGAGPNPNKWIENPSNHHFYKVIDSGNWIECEAEAQKQGAHLLTINDHDEQNWLMTTFGVDKRYWIGYTDKDEEGKWRWISGELSGYTNWANGEPNDWNDCEDYAEMNWTTDGKWNDNGPCGSDWSESRTAIIEKSLSDTTPPDGSIIISEGAEYTKTRDVILNLSAQDNVGVAAYLTSEDSIQPSSSDVRWVFIDTPTTDLSKEVSFELSDGDGEKTVYVWYKDEAGNVSGPASDSIILDTVLPTIISRNPANDQTNVAIDTNIVVTFSEAMDSKTINNGSFVLKKDGSDTPIGGDISISDDKKTATFNPTADLENGKKYTATVTTAVTDLAGNQMKDNYPWSFTTKGILCSYSLDPEEASFDSQGGKGGFEITTASESCCWSATKDVDWVEIIGESSGCGSKKVEYSVGKNPGSQRDGKITVGNKIHTIHQEGKEPCANNDQYEPNDNFNESYGPLVSGNEYIGKICNPSDSDFYTIDMKSSGTILLSLDVPDDKDYDLYLYNSSKEEVEYSTEGKGVTEQLRYDVKSPGTYYVKVIGNGSNNYSESQTYTLLGTWNSWKIEELDSPKTIANFCPKAIDVDANNYVHIAYGGNHLYYARFNGNTWIHETVDESSGVGQFASLKIDTSGNAHISYYDKKNGKLKYANNVSGTWNIEIADNSQDVGMYSSLALDKSGNVHISYYDKKNKDLKYANNMSGSWKNIVVDSGGSVGKYTCIRARNEGKVYISYYDEGNKRLKYATNISGKWQYYVLDETGRVGEYTSLAIDKTGAVHICYYDEKNKNLKYCSNASGKWKSEVVDSIGRVGKYTSLIISSDKAHVSYYDETKKNLKYGSNSLGSWKSAVVDRIGDVGKFTSIDMDSSDKVHISYFDSTKKVLKHATNAD